MATVDLVSGTLVGIFDLDLLAIYVATVALVGLTNMVRVAVDLATMDLVAVNLATVGFMN